MGGGLRLQGVAVFDTNGLDKPPIFAFEPYGYVERWWFFARLGAMISWNPAKGFSDDPILAFRIAAGARFP